ncbi:unnamed protein product [Mytilus coruscus]|uniref:Uncharacterized protein n=1 Tax=Mytilus coruscus TaxID=42192 RepID=A0A6J8F2Y2_MYTCO|nr:unnamed protein product [Mytilus coruscus]
MLHRSFDAAVKANEEKLLIPTRAGETRWVGHLLLAVNNLITSYKFIVAHLGQLTEPIERVSVDSKARAIAFLKLLKPKNIVCFLLFLVDVLKTLRHLSLKLQDRKCLIADQYSALSSTMEIQIKYKTSDGPYLRKVIDKTEFQGVKLTFCNNVEFIAVRQNLLDKLLEFLDKRFSEFSTTSIVQATRIADLQIWPKSWEAFKVYGDEDLQTIVDHFELILSHAGVITEDAELEWTLLKKDVQDLQILFPTKVAKENFADLTQSRMGDFVGVYYKMYLNYQDGKEFYLSEDVQSKIDDMVEYHADLQDDK